MMHQAARPRGFYAILTLLHCDLQHLRLRLQLGVLIWVRWPEGHARMLAGGTRVQVPVGDGRAAVAVTLGVTWCVHDALHVRTPLLSPAAGDPSRGREERQAGS